MVQEREVFLGLPAFVETLAEAVVGQTEPRGREQVVAVGVAREGTWLTHQRIDHVPVMHRVLVPTHQPRQRVGEFVRVPDLDAVGVEPGFHPLANQSAVDRVGAAVNVDQAPRIDAATHLEATGQSLVGQGRECRDLLGEAVTPSIVANLHDPLQETHVLLAAGEVPTPPQQQRLIDGRFEVVVRRFGIAVLVRLPNIDPLSLHTVVSQKIAVASLELPRRRQVVHSRSETVAAVPPWRAPEFPHRVLEPIGECLERLRSTQAYRLPVRVGQDKVVDQMLQWLPRDRDAQRIHAGEIGRRQVAGPMHLAEDRELPRSVAGTPLPHATLKGAAVRIEVLAGVLLTEPVEESLGSELRLGHQLRFDLGPDRGERIDPSAIGAGRLLADAGKRGVVSVMTGSLVGHPCPPGREGQRDSLVE